MGALPHLFLSLFNKKLYPLRKIENSKLKHHHMVHTHTLLFEKNISQCASSPSRHGNTYEENPLNILSFTLK